jgi:Ribbon-helix-helix protein, copG family
MADALANVIAVLPSTDSARWIVARLTPDSRTRSAAAQRSKARDDTVMAELKREAARQGRTMSELVETALRLLLASRRKRGRSPALPKFRSGGALVDVADRDALYHAMEGR